METLQSRLAYTFRDPDLLQQALTHPSAAGKPHNQRFEFLGDAVLQMLCTEHLFQTQPAAREGQLTPQRAACVSRTSLLTLARSLQLGPCLLMSRAEEANRGRQRDSILADAMEAILGAVYLDGGWEAARQVSAAVLEPHWNALLASSSPDNPKGRLQEILQGLANDVPSYALVEASGPEHARHFTVSVHWQGREIGRGTASSKKQAEVLAAAAALQSAPWSESADPDSSLPLGSS